MAKPVLLQDDFSGGMKPDIPPSKMPKNACLRMQDFIPNHNDQPLGIRQGWSRIGGIMAGSYGAAIAFAPFSSNAQLVGIDNLGTVYQVPHTSDSANTNRGTAQVPLQPPVFYRNKLYIPSDGISTIKSYDGSSSVIAAAGSPPSGMLCTVYKDHLVLARGGADVQRIWFSNAADAGSWDTAVDGQWMDASFPITGLGVIRNMMLVFAEQGVERVRGDIIPGVAGSDMVREPLPIPGCSDPASIAIADDVCYYANAAGVYMTDGITSIDLTEQCDYKRWWAKTLFSYDGSWNLAGGYFQGKYIVVAHDGAEFRICTVFDVKKRAAYEFTNIPATMFAAAPTGHAQSYPGGLYMVERNAPWSARFSNVFGYVSAVDAYNSYQGDDNGAFKSPKLRSGYFVGKPGNKRVKKVYVSFDMAFGETVGLRTFGDQNSQSPTATFTLTGKGDEGYRMQKIPIARGHREGIEIEITQPNWAPTSGPLTIRRLEAEMQEQEPSRRL